MAESHRSRSGVTSRHVTAPPSPSPTPPHQNVPFHTPVKLRMTDHSQYRNTVDLEKKRDAVIHDLCNAVPEVELDDYFDKLLPPISADFNVEAILENLRNSEVIMPNGRWRKFSDVDPKGSKENETKVFANLKTIFAAVIQAAKTLTPNQANNQQFDLIVDPDHTPQSDRKNKTRPDAFLVGMSVAVAALAKLIGSGRFSWYEMLCPQEFKKDDGPNAINDNVSKLVFSMQQIMSLDPCRRFTLGITIENRTTRLWFGSRAVVLKTKPFDFMEDHRYLVRLFLTLSFSSPTDLGWDPTIKSLIASSPSEKRVYQLKLGNECYTTLKLLSDYSADSPIGRATRVWLVRAESDQKEYVLKDVWIDNDREPEHQIREALLDDIEKAFGQAARDKVARHMLTPVAHEKVCVAPGVEDDTTTVMMRGWTPSLDTARLVPLTIELRSVDPVTQSLGPMSAHDANARPFLKAHVRAIPSIRRKIHYRIVFKEHATTLYQEPSLDNVFTSATQVIETLEIIHASGWVHRDISGGNMYWYDDPAGEARGLLADFEYCKRKSDQSLHDWVRTGTPDFMAAEALAHKYIYRPVAERMQEDFSDDDELDEEPSEDGAELKIETEQKTDDRDPNFAFNDLHDLESIWWVLVWIIFFKDDPVRNPQRYLAPGRQTRMESLFARGRNYAPRNELLTGLTDLSSPSVTALPGYFNPAIKMLIGASRLLVRAYRDAEKSFPDIDVNAFQIHSVFVDYLSRPMRQKLRAIQLVPIKLVQDEEHVDAQVGQKRKPTMNSNTSASKKIRSYT